MKKIIISTKPVLEVWDYSLFLNDNDGFKFITLPVGLSSDYLTKDSNF